MTPLASATRVAIRRRILDWYRDHGRHDLPWRHTDDLYAVTLAEIMLQQTNVPKVVTKYHDFLALFPSWVALAAAPQSAVLTAWRGLGYNRRALNLHRAAQIVARDYAGTMPDDPAALEALPGIGPYTSRSIPAFGHNADVAAVDVNITRLLRRWHDAPDMTPAAQRVAADALLPQGASRDWHNALMDFASIVCTKRAPRCDACPLARVCRSAGAPRDSEAPKKREPGRTESGRHIPRRIYRGRIVEALRSGPLAAAAIGPRIKTDWDVATDAAWLDDILAALAAEGMIARTGTRWHLG